MQSQLGSLAPQAGQTVLSLSVTAQYLGVAGGAAVGSFALKATESAANLGFFGSLFHAGALVVLLTALKPRPLIASET
jgi:predicted MFS family arabinose efflux permease